MEQEFKKENALNNIYSRGVRGAITIENNTKEDIKDATVELLEKMLFENNIELKDIAFAIFTLTADIDAAFPAKYAREVMGFNTVPMMCYNEADIKDSLKKCIRILLSINTTKSQDEIKHIYLKGAKVLRQDLK